MYGSHDSLRDDYEVSTPEIDARIEVCRASSVSWGGRLTGAGFGGCTVHLVPVDGVEAFLAELVAAGVTSSEAPPWATRAAAGAEVFEVSET